MAVLPTLLPTGTDAVGGWTDEGGGTTNLHLNIDETTAGDAAYIRSGTSGATAALFPFTDTPSDFASMTALSVEIRHSRGTVEGGSAGGDDTYTLWVQVVDAGGNGLTTEMQIETGTTGYTTKTETVVFTNFFGTNDKTNWDGARISVRAVHSQSMGNDGHRIWIDFIRLVNGTYAQSYDLDQTAFRFRNDDGSETTATWKAAENTDTSIDIGELFRLRFVVQNDSATVAATDLQGNLWCKINAGSYFLVPTTTTSGVHLALSSNFADQDATTEQLIAGTGTFEAGVMVESNNFGGGNEIDVPTSGFTEIEYSIRTIYDATGGNAVVPGDVLTFRLRQRIPPATILDFTTYTEEPVVTLIGYPTRWTNIFRGQLGGPFEASNGDLFAVMPSILVTTDGDHATVWRKPSGGAWAQVASLGSVNGAPNLTAGQGGHHRNCVAYADGDTLHFAWVTADDTLVNTNCGVNYAAWNMSTNTQIGSVEEVAAIINVVHDLTVRTRSDGDVVIAWTVIDVGGTNTGLVELVHGSAGSWSSIVSVETTDVSLHGTTIVVDQSNDDTHVFWVYGNEIFHERMNSSGTLSGTVDQVSTTAGGGLVGFAHSLSSDGGTQRAHDAVIFDGDFFVLDTNDAGTVKVWQGTVGDDPSDWAVTTIATTTVDDVQSRDDETAVGFVEAGGRLFIVWVRESDQEIVYQEYTGSWGSVTETNIITVFENAFVTFTGQVVSGDVILYGFYNVHTDNPNDTGPHARARDFSFNLGAEAGGGGGGTTFSGWWGFIQGW